MLTDDYSRMPTSIRVEAGNAVAAFLSRVRVAKSGRRAWNQNNVRKNRSAHVPQRFPDPPGALPVPSGSVLGKSSESFLRIWSVTPGRPPTRIKVSWGDLRTMAITNDTLECDEVRSSHC